MEASFIATAQELREHPRDYRPHVVVRGAGASCAAFPAGDTARRRVPVMQNFVDVLGLTQVGSERTQIAPRSTLTMNGRSVRIVRNNFA